MPTAACTHSPGLYKAGEKANLQCAILLRSEPPDGTARVARSGLLAQPTAITRFVNGFVNETLRNQRDSVESRATDQTGDRR
jgi:hypothetical protein